VNMYSKTDTDIMRGEGGPVRLFWTLSEGTLMPRAGVLSASLECTKNGNVHRKIGVLDQHSV
jgi:hypothetical protein